MKKVLSATAFFALVLWGCTTLSGVLHAQDTAAGQALTTDSLKMTLDNMGLEPKKIGDRYQMMIKQDTWKIFVTITLATNNTKLLMRAHLASPADASKGDASQWLNLLSNNESLCPSTFALDKEQKNLYLIHSFDNRAVTPAVLRRETDNFATNIRKTAALWKSFVK